MSWQTDLSAALQDARKSAKMRNTDIAKALNINSVYVCQVQNFAKYGRTPSIDLIVAWLTACKSTLAVKIPARRRGRLTVKSAKMHVIRVAKS